MSQFLALFDFVRLSSRSRFSRTFKFLNSLIIALLLAGLLLSVFAEPAQAVAPRPSDLSANNWLTSLRTSFNQGLFGVFSQNGINPRVGEFEQIANLSGLRENPQQILAKAEQQARIGAALQNATQAQNAITLEKAFQDAAKEFNIPVDLLKAASYAISGWEQRPGLASVSGSYGMMQLTQNQAIDYLSEAAKLIGIEPELLKTDTGLNIRAGTALLRQKAREFGSTLANSTSLTELGAVLERWSGYSPGIAQLYINEVFDLLRGGFSAKTSSGETLTIVAQGPNLVTPNVDVARDPTKVPAKAVPPFDYPGTTALPVGVPSAPTVNFSTGRSAAVKYIVIGLGAAPTARGLLNVYTNPAYRKSSHYVIDTNGTAYQLVSEADTAFFINGPPAPNPPFDNPNIISISMAGFYNAKPDTTRQCTTGYETWLIILPAVRE